MHRIGLVCTAFALAVFASPVTAQQTAPAQQTTPAVPPASTPDQPASPGGPPPFPPMPSRPPQHRWVDTGGHHRAARSQHKATHESRRARRGHHAAKPAHHRLTRTEKNIRYCHGLSHRRVMHNRICVALKRHEEVEKRRDLKAAHRRHGPEHHRLTRTEKNVRYCGSLSHRRMVHNRTCVALERNERANKHRDAKHHRKAEHRRAADRQSARHHASRRHKS